jgi:predicted RND superfamily exporter protein
MEAFARWLVRRPLAVVVANLLVTLALGAYALHIRIESSLESVLPAGDPKIAYYDETRRLFGSDDVGVLGVVADDVFAPATIEKIARVTNELAKIDGITQVISITNVVDPAENVLSPPPLLLRIPPPPEEVERVKAKLKRVPLYGRNLVADDFRGAAINIFFRDMTDAEYAALDIDQKIRTLLDASRGPEEFYFTGAAHVKQAAVGLMRHDLYRFTPLALTLMLLVFWISFRSVRGVALPTIAVAGALIWTLGLMVLAGESLSLGTFVLPPLLLVVGASYAIHVMARYYEQVPLGGSRDDVVVRAFTRVWLPLVISAVVTAIGFGSLMANRINAIRDFGAFAVVGILCVTVTSLTFLPAALRLLSLEQRSHRSGRVAPMLATTLRRLGHWVYERQRPMLVAAGIASLVAILGALRIQVDSDFLYYFGRNSEVRIAAETINQRITGTNPFYVVIDSETPGLLKRWEVLKMVKDLQAYLATLPGVTSSISFVDYLELLEAGLAKGSEGDIIVDDQGNLVAAEKPKSFWEEPRNLDPLFDMVSRRPETFRGVVTPDFAKGSILVRTNLNGSSHIEATLDKVRAYVAGYFPPDVPVRLTGTLVLLTGTASDIVSGQVKSLTFALVVIFLVMAVMFLSAKVGFLAIIPNVLPIVIFFGVMGWMGIYLNLGTSLIAAIALGIAVDSTIHYMARLNQELQGETDQTEAIVRTLASVGVPIVYAMLALFLGFLVFGLSSFVPIQNFGLLASITMVTALVANLVLLPALLATTKIITIWDLLGVRLGNDPARTIPLFSGLRPAQARIVVLMGEMRRFGRGDTIVRRGDQGREMFVIIRGVTEVWAGADSERRRVAQHQRGDVFGEMALVRHNERSADVVAASDVELLAVDERFLERIQRRYPRIASKVFLNLTRILSDRLQSMTDAYVAARA